MNYFSYFGKKCVEVYNEAHETDYDIETFFYDVIFPVAFDYDISKMFFYVQSTPIMKNLDKEQKTWALDRLITHRKTLFKERIEEIKAGEATAHGFIYLGNGAASLSGSTSGQIALDYADDFPPVEEIYSSWISIMISVGLSGGVDVLTENKDIIRHLINGWEYYRLYLNDALNKGKQLPAWNCLWLTYGYKYRNDPERAYYEVLKKKAAKELSAVIKDGKEKGLNSLTRCNWTETIFNLAKETGALKDNFYAFSLGNTNKTFGVFKVNLEGIERVYDAWEALLSRHGYEIDPHMEDYFKAKYKVHNAIEHGGIGLRTIEPADINFANVRNREDDVKKSIVKQSWLIAMLHNDKLKEASETLAKTLSVNEKKRTSIRSKLLGESRLLKGAFIRELTSLYSDNLTDELFKIIELIDSEDISKEQFYYFQDITRARYLYYSKR